MNGQKAGAVTRGEMEYVCPSRIQKGSWEAGPDKRKVNPWVQEGPSQPGPTIEMHSALGMFTETGRTLAGSRGEEGGCGGVETMESLIQLGEMRLQGR